MNVTELIAPIVILTMFGLLFYNIINPKHRKRTVKDTAKILRDLPIRSTPVPNVPEVRSTSIPKIDDMEDTPNGAIIKDNQEQGIFIIYRDASGQKSKRRITVKSIETTNENVAIIKAFCHERSAMRTFKSDRILEAIDIHTGEIFDDPRGILKLVGVNVKTLKPLATPDILNTYQNSLKILTFIARCDGDFANEESRVICDYLKTKADVTKYQMKSIQKHIHHMHPTEDAFFNAIDDLEQESPTELKNIARVANVLIKADGHIAEDEEDYLDEILECVAE
jgi:tellurite resistance protein